MQCNIDAKGKAVRLVYGLTLLVAGLIVGGLALAGVFAGWWLWAVSAALVLMGAFAVFEARQGWCVVRAMGIKTRY